MEQFPRYLFLPTIGKDGREKVLPPAHPFIPPTIPSYRKISMPKREKSRADVRAHHTPASFEKGRGATFPSRAGGRPRGRGEGGEEEESTFAFQGGEGRSRAGDAFSRQMERCMLPKRARKRMYVHTVCQSNGIPGCGGCDLPSRHLRPRHFPSLPIPIGTQCADETEGLSAGGGGAFRK